MIGDLLLIAVRLAHALSAAIWIGSAFLLTVAPSAVWEVPDHERRGLREGFRLGVAVFVVSGAVMTAERLSSAALPPTYVAVLGFKIALAVWMFGMARRLDAASPARREGARRLLIAGVGIYILALILRRIFEQSVRL